MAEIITQEAIAKLKEDVKEDTNVDDESFVSDSLEDL